MTVILFDDSSRETLLPLTFTRPVAAIRIGIMTIAEKWRMAGFADIVYQTAPYLQECFSAGAAAGGCYINGSVCPNEALVEAIAGLEEGEALLSGEVVLAARNEGPFSCDDLSSVRQIQFSGPFTRIVYPEDIFTFNGEQLRYDFKRITNGRTSAAISGTNTIIGDDFFAEEGADAECSVFNTTSGPIYLAKHAEVWEGCTVRGPFALGEHSQLKMGARIYGMTTIGPHCRIGGEVNNAVVFGFSSKGHDGYLGNAVLGEWCNLGADTNNSNLKNNYGEVALWDYSSRAMRNTGLQFCGVIMADHVKCGINTMFNTGTIAGVGSNVFGGGFQQKFIPDFSWGDPHTQETYRLDKFFETLHRVFARRDRVLTAAEKSVLTHVFELTRSYRPN